MANYPQCVLDWVLDIVFPKSCLGCGRFTYNGDFDYVCRKCFGEINLKNVFECIGCKRQTQFGLTCVSCRKDNSIDQLLIAAELSDPPVEKMLKACKYKFISNLSVPLSLLARKCVKKLLFKGFNLFEDNPLIVPVPLHARRLNWRGFNQAQLVARNLSDVFLASYGEDILARVVYAKNQADIKGRENRIGNVGNNFVVKNAEAAKGRTIILIDDICTTGATLNECARVLKNPSVGKGAKRVIGLVIARG